MIATQQIEYYEGDVVFQGFLAYNKDASSKQPGVMIAHDWGGRGDFVCNKARELATMGYVGFAIDMYGQAQLGHDKVERRALLNPLMENRPLLLARMIAAYNTFAHLPQVDKEKIAAIGYCFGGLCVLDLARSGTDVKGVVSFHGRLTAAEHTRNTPVSAKILVLHGYDDPLVRPEQIELFAAEMNERTADWQVHMYGLTQHSFAIPGANDNEMGLHYDAKADYRSWESTIAFLQEVLE